MQSYQRPALRLNTKPHHPTSLIDCTDTSDNELIVVEGVSAANAIKAVRNRQNQAVLPMQGKIPNASRTSKTRLLAHPNVADLIQSIHTERLVETELDIFRYQQVVLLGDPDADGVHASILLVLFLYQHVPCLVEQGRLSLARAPLFGFYQNDKCVAVAYSEQHAKEVAARLSDSFSVLSDKRRFKGLASLDADLRLALLAPDHPVRKRLSLQDCEALCQPFL